MKAKEKLPLPKTCEHLQDIDAFAYLIPDESMSPRFKKGSTVVFISNKKPKHNDIVLASIVRMTLPVVCKYNLDTRNLDDLSIQLIPEDCAWVTNIINDKTSLIIHGVESDFATVMF